MSAAMATILHLTHRDTPAHRLRALADVLRVPGFEQRVVHVGDGAPAIALPQRPSATGLLIAAPFVAPLVLRRLVPSGRATVIHVWSLSALRWGLAALTRQRIEAAGRAGLLVDVSLPLKPASGRRLGNTLRSDAGIRLVLCDPPELAALEMWRIDAARVVQLPSDVSHAALARVDREAVRRSLRLDPSHRAVLLTPPVERSTDGFTAAWGALVVQRARAEVRLIVPDDSREVDRIRRLVDAVGQANVTRFPGHRLAPAELVIAADLAMSLPRGPAPMVGIRWSLAAGMPTIVADTTALRRALGDDPRLVWCPPADRRAAARAVLETLNGGESCARIPIAIAETETPTSVLARVYCELLGLRQSNRSAT